MTEDKNDKLLYPEDRKIVDGEPSEDLESYIKKKDLQNQVLQKLVDKISHPDELRKKENEEQH
jgi:hypothetical protein